MKKIILTVLILMIITGCNQNKDSTTFSSSPPPMDLSDTGMNNSEVRIHIPSYNYRTDYEEWAEYFQERFDIQVSVYTKNDVYKNDDDEKYLYYGLDNDVVPYLKIANIYWENKNIDRYGIYLANLYHYHYYYQFPINYSAKNISERKLEPPELWRSLNEYSITNNLSSELLEPYTDNNGNIWALPYEYVYPEVKVRKYNKDILNEVGANIPQNITELYNLLIKVKSETDIPNILPSMKRGAVFKGFEDIVNAFGIKTSATSEIESFYSIQFDEDEGEYVDIAFSERMKQCIEFFIALIDTDKINLESSIQTSNELFYDNEIFSVYDILDREEDLVIPQTSKLYAYDYTPVLYFLPTRYVYVIGREQEYSFDIDNLFDALYLSLNTKLSARFGKENEDYTFYENLVSINRERFDSAPKLIGQFPEDGYKLINNNKLQQFKEEKTEDNIKNGYYEALTPLKAAMESRLNRAFVDEYMRSKYQSLSSVLFANTFYTMLSDYFFDENRGSVEEFLERYREEMASQQNDRLVQISFYMGAICELNSSY